MNPAQPNDDDVLQSEPVSANTEPQMPLGLKWFLDAYDNPWQFSVQRTGIDELKDAVNRVAERDGKLPRVVVSFTSLPKRFVRHAHNMVRILKRQSYTPDAIYIAVPQTSRRSNESFTIPDWLAKDELVTVLRPSVDYGPATKLIPALERETELGNLDTRIITVDDDNEGGWTDDSLIGLFAYSLYFEDMAVGYTGWNATCMVSDARCETRYSGVRGRQFADRKYNFIRQSNDQACHTLSDWLPDYYNLCMGAVRRNFIAYTDVIEGYKGAAYQPRFFNISDLKRIVQEDELKPFLLVDDVWFSGWLGVRNVSRIVVNPAIHPNSSLRKRLEELSRQRGISTNQTELSERDRSRLEGIDTVEKGLHELSNEFVPANHDGVVWFESLHAWTPGLWDRPEGFTYLTEKVDSSLNISV